MARSPLSVRRLTVALGAALALAACGGGSDAGDGAEGVLEVVGTDDLQFEPSSLEAAAGEITVELTCEDAVAHTFVLEETAETVADCNAGGTDSGSVELAAGAYTFYCDVPGHRSAGMEGVLTVA